MEVIISNKYQVVIPKAVRKNLDLKPGQRVRITNSPGGKITMETLDSPQEALRRYAGSIKKGPWGKDPVKYIRTVRGEWDS